MLFPTLISCNHKFYSTCVMTGRSLMVTKFVTLLLTVMTRMTKCCVGNATLNLVSIRCSVCLPLSVFPFQSVSLSVFLSVCLSTYPAVYLSVCIYPSVSISDLSYLCNLECGKCLIAYLFMYQSIHPSIHPSIFPCDCFINTASFLKHI